MSPQRKAELEKQEQLCKCNDNGKALYLREGYGSSTTVNDLRCLIDDLNQTMVWVGRGQEGQNIADLARAGYTVSLSAAMYCEAQGP